MLDGLTLNQGDGEAILEDFDLATIKYAEVFRGANAFKYGALSTANGCVHISWVVKDGSLELDWQERGGPAIDGSPEQEGFGSKLARRGMNGQLHGEIAFDWAAEGLTVHLSAPTERLTL